MCYKCRFRCLIRGLMSPTSQPELSPSNTRTSTHSSIENHSVPPFKHNTTALIFAAIPPSPSPPPPPSQKLSGPFMWAAAERGTLSGNRCSAGLMLALRWSVRFANMKQSWLHSGDPRPPPPPITPSPSLFEGSQVPKTHAAVLNMKHQTHQSVCQMFFEGAGRGGGAMPDWIYLSSPLMTQVNGKVFRDVGLSEEARHQWRLRMTAGAVH